MCQLLILCDNCAKRLLHEQRLTKRESVTFSNTMRRHFVTTKEGSCAVNVHFSKTNCADITLQMAAASINISDSHPSSDFGFSILKSESAHQVLSSPLIRYHRTGGGKTGRKILRFVDKITKSKYFQKATENEFIRKKFEEMSNTPLLLTVEVRELSGTLVVNIPPPPTDRIW